jgi:hypothetical protein
VDCAFPTTGIRRHPKSAQYSVSPGLAIVVPSMY